ncbi:hypothetical protein MBLNU13_g03356t2 [Cladosporium sp. NU13]
MESVQVSGEMVMGIEWMLFTFAYTFVAMRIGLRLARQQQKHIIVSDIFLIISAICLLGLITCDTLSYTLGAMNSEFALADLVTAADAKEQSTLDKISFASNFFYDVGLYFPKAAILSLYFELFPSTMPKLRMALYIVTGYTVASGLTTLGINTFYCPHVPDNWSRAEGSCSVFNSLLVLQISWALNFSADISIFLLPFPLIRVLELKRRQRNGLILTFALGILTIIVSATRFIRIQTGTDWDRAYIWSMAEMCIAIMVVSMPALKYLLRYWKSSSSSPSTSPSSYYNTEFSDPPRGNRRRGQMSCTFGDETGSDVELNRIVVDEGILETKEVCVDSAPAPGVCGVYDFAAEKRWAEDGQVPQQSHP